MKDHFIEFLLSFCLLLVMIWACDDDATGPAEVPTPAIVSIEPAAGFAGESATITGSNFSPDPKENLIRFGHHPNFGYKSIRPDAATETTLTFTRPLISSTTPGEDITTALQVRRLDDPEQALSDALEITFSPLIDIFAEGFGNVRGITFDADGNCYVSDVDAPAIYKITPDGDQSVYAEVLGLGAMVFGNDGFLYLGQFGGPLYEADQAIVRIPPGGGGSEVFAEITQGRPMTMDFDANGNLYVGLADAEDDKALWRITPGGEMSELDSGAPTWFLSVRVSDGHLYMFDRALDPPSTLRKAPITSDGIGTPELLWASDGERLFATGFAIDTNGAVYLGCHWDCFGLNRINANGSFEKLLTLPTDNLKFLAFWGKDVYVTTQFNGLIYKVFVGVEGGGR